MKGKARSNKQRQLSGEESFMRDQQVTGVKAASRPKTGHIKA